VGKVFFLPTSLIGINGGFRYLPTLLFYLSKKGIKMNPKPENIGKIGRLRELKPVFKLWPKNTIKVYRP